MKKYSEQIIFDLIVVVVFITISIHFQLNQSLISQFVSIFVMINTLLFMYIQDYKKEVIQYRPYLVYYKIEMIEHNSKIVEKDNNSITVTLPSTTLKIFVQNKSMGMCKDIKIKEVAFRAYPNIDKNLLEDSEKDGSLLFISSKTLLQGEETMIQLNVVESYDKELPQHIILQIQFEDIFRNVYEEIIRITKDKNSEIYSDVEFKNNYKH